MQHSNIFIDPEIDLNNKTMVSIIIQYKTKPAQVAVANAEKSGFPLTMESAKREVEQSHKRFHEDVNKYLITNNVPFSISHTYKLSLNGVSMTLPANEIKTLLNFKEIESIYTNKEYHLDPPILPK